MMKPDLLQYLNPHQQRSVEECERCGCGTCQDALKFLTVVAERAMATARPDEAAARPDEAKS